MDPPNMTMPCTECGKTFRSSKALFGHMRCQDHEVAACLLILANQGTSLPEYSNSGGGFECSSCKKVFGSHQALGGHRASHKNVKGCYANTKKDECCNGGGDQVSLGHKCSVCFRVFSTGQALGGHKRCHWDKMDIASTVSAFHLDFNLNFPVPQNHHHSNTSFSSALPDLDLRLRL